MTTSPDVDLALAIRYLRILDPAAAATGRFTYQTFHDTEAEEKDESLARVIPGPARGRLVDLHERGAGIYVTVNETDGRGRCSENIKRIRAVWREADAADLPELPIEPSLVIETSPGHAHEYFLVADDWLADEQGRADFKAVMERMVESYGSDPGAKDLPRVLRVPGFLHRKYEPHLVRISKPNGSGEEVHRYTRAAILKAFPPIERPETKSKPQPRTRVKDEVDDFERARDALGHINPDTREVRVRIGMALKDHFDEAGRALWNQWLGDRCNERVQARAWRLFGRRDGITIATLFHYALQAGWTDKRDRQSNNGQQSAANGKGAAEEEATDSPLEDKPELEPCSIEETLEVFERWLILPNLTPVYAMLGTVAANLLPGDPVWLGIIGPPSSAKTELLNSTSMLPKVVQAATLTPAGLLSGTPKKQYDKKAKGGLLRQIGVFGILVLKDFGSILSMRQEAKAEVLAALREIYDGSWTRHLGTDGGRTLDWQGKIALLFAATGVIDTHYGVIGAMGDRFLLSRLAPVDKGQFERALKHVGGATKQMRKELAESVARLFAGRRNEPREITEDEVKRIDDIILKVVRLRGAVERDRISREVEAVYGAEGVARIGLTLERLLAGLDTLGVDREKALEVVESVAMDSVPPIRRRAYEFLVEIDGATATTPAVAKQLALPTNTVRRALEDLTAYGLAERTSQGQGNADLWCVAGGPQ